MRYKLSPIVSNKIINYQFDNDIITATCGELTNTYDLTALTDSFYKDVENEYGDIITVPYIIETVFEFAPIINAYKDETGVLNVALLNFIKENAENNEKYPVWVEV